MQINEDTLSCATLSFAAYHKCALIVRVAISPASGLCKSSTKSRTRTCTRARGPRGCLSTVRSVTAPYLFRPRRSSAILPFGFSYPQQHPHPYRPGAAQDVASATSTVCQGHCRSPRRCPALCSRGQHGPSPDGSGLPQGDGQCVSGARKDEEGHDHRQRLEGAPRGKPFCLSFLDPTESSLLTSLNA